MTEQLTNAQAEELYKLDLAVKRATERINELKDIVKANYKPGTHQFGNVLVTVKESKGFDKEAASKAFPEEDNPTKYKTEVDPKAFSDKEKEKFLKAPTLSVSLGTVTE